MNETKTNVDKINSFLAHLDSQCEKINAGNFDSFTDSSIQSSNSPQDNQNNSLSSMPQQLQKKSSNSSQNIQYSEQLSNSLSTKENSMNKKENSFNKKNMKQKSQSQIISPQDEIDYDINDEITRKNRTWCERSLEQLEMTIQLLDQCLDNDLKDLNRQQNVINLCKKQIDEVKSVYPI